MSVRHLEYLFKPKSVAVIGASRREGSIGNVVVRNLLQGGFDGPIMPVNPKYDAIGGVLAYPDVNTLPVTPDLAVICTPPRVAPEIIRNLGERGTRGAVVMTTGFADPQPDGRGRLLDAMLEAAAPYKLRILGPNCIGTLVPGIGLNASFAHAPALPGRIAFVSQSGAMCMAVLDWARTSNLGFSHFISLGDRADVDFGDVLDYLTSEPTTGAILLYIESINHARKFMSAARAAARNKPILAIKAGRAAAYPDAESNDVALLEQFDQIYDSALRRAGIVRVHHVDELFDAAETLARSRPLRGERLAILTNGGGLGMMAADALIKGGGRLAKLSEETIRELDAVLPRGWSGGNPVDIMGDAPSERYADALRVMLKDAGCDAYLILNVPTAISSSETTAREVIGIIKDARRNILTSWVGSESAVPARQIFAAEGIPTYETPDKAVRAFLHILNFRKTQEILMETPSSAPTTFSPDREKARRIIDEALAHGASVLSEPQAKAVLSAYGIPVVDAYEAKGPQDAGEVADRIGYPVALKILSPDVAHKSDVGGVELDLENRGEVENAARAISARLRELMPQARMEGFTVQKMARRPGAIEVFICTQLDPVFGPVIYFGHGGAAVEVIADREVALPPLNMSLAMKLIERTRVSRLLSAYRAHKAADLEAIALTLNQVSQLIIDFGEIEELRINPLFADDKGVLALDARMRLRRFTSGTGDHLAIRPYPAEAEEHLVLRDGRKLLIRPIRSEDEPAYKEFLARMNPEDIHYRFFSLVREFPHAQLARFTQIDYDREMAFVATTTDDAGKGETLGSVRAIADPDNTCAEFAVIVRSDMKRQGLGRALMEKLIDYYRSIGTKKIYGEILAENHAMLELAKQLGFERVPSKDPTVAAVELQLG